MLLEPLVARLEKSLDYAGCQIRPLEAIRGRQSFLIFLPGLDRLLLKEESHPALPWIEACAAALWDRARIEIILKDKTLLCRWVYWSPIQIIAHGFVFVAFVTLGHPGTESFIFYLIANLIPLGLSLSARRQLLRMIGASGFIRSQLV